MGRTIKSNDMVWSGVQYLNGAAVKCSLFIRIRRARKYAHLTVRRGDMEIAGKGVAWVGDEPSLVTKRVPLDSLHAEIDSLVRGY